jgi:hypothetical protein
MMSAVKKPYQKRLVDDVGLLHFVCGLGAYAGQVVTIQAHYGPFRWIRTQDGQDFYGVGKGLLVTR